MTVKSILAVDIHSTEEWKEGMQEWESRETIERIRETLVRLGQAVMIVSNSWELIQELGSLSPYSKSQKPSCNTIPEDLPLVWNLVEGYKSPNREGYIPSLCEFIGIPATGSSAYSQSLSLDKYLLNRFLSKENYPFIAKSQLLNSIPISNEVAFPCFIKPRAEGSGMGVSQKSILHSESELSRFLEDWIPQKKYQEWILEEYLPGTEYTVACLELEPGEWLIIPARLSYPDSVYGEKVKRKDSMPESFDFQMSARTSRFLTESSSLILERLQAEGYARLDWKEDVHGNCRFLEANLTPGISVIYSLFPKIIMEKMDWNYEKILSTIISISWKNFHTQKRYQYGRNSCEKFFG